MTYTTQWKLKTFLDAHGITPYKLSKLTHGKLSRTSVYSLSSDRVEAVKLDSLAAIIPALSELTGRQVTVSDLLEVVPQGQREALSASGLPYTGDPETDEILDDPEIVARLLASKREWDSLTKQEREAKYQAKLASGEMKTIEQVIEEQGIDFTEAEEV